MKKQVLFIQGGGAGAYEEDNQLAASLQDALGAEYNVLYPRMPNEDDPEYEAWKEQISKELAELDGAAILVGHSAGGTILLRYISVEKVEGTIAGIFLISTPFWGAEDWLVDEYTLRKGLASESPNGPPIFFYHSRDDEVVPFAHLAMYAAKLPGGIFRQLDGGGHQLNNNLAEVAADIKSLEDLQGS
jgi:predicted alpha/beta hydrolase family esterase